MHKAFKACTAVLLALVMTVSLVNGALAAVVRNDDDTISYEPLEQGVYSKGGYTIDKVSHPTLGGEGVFCCPWAQFVVYLILYNQADFPPEGGTTVEKTTLPAAGGVLPRGAAAGMQFSDDGEHAGGRASPCAPAFG